MKKILIPVDKANHIIAGYLIYFIFSFFLSPLLAVIPVMVIGAIKEVYDMSSGKGTPDVYDFLATLIGCIPMLILNLIK